MEKIVIRKDVYEELVEKGYGKKDLSKLTKVQITDKNGHTRNVYRKMGEVPKDGKKGKQEVEVKEKTSKLKVPDETSSFETDVNRMVKLKKENYREFTIQLEKLHSKYTISKWQDLYNKIREKEYAKNTKSKDYTVGQEINFSSQGREGLNGKVTAIGVLGVTVKAANGKIYTVNYDEISKVEKEDKPKKEDKPIFNASKYMKALDQMKKIENAYKKQKEEYDFYERTGTLDRKPYYVQKPKDLTENSDYMELKKYVDAFK